MNPWRYTRRWRRLQAEGCLFEPTGPEYLRLESAGNCELEFRQYVGPRFVSAGLRAEYSPSDRLILRNEAIFPDELEADYVSDLEVAIGTGLFDHWVCSQTPPKVGCTIRITGVTWHPVESSEVAFYRAARGLASRIDESERWVELRDPSGEDATLKQDQE